MSSIWKPLAGFAAAVCTGLSVVTAASAHESWLQPVAFFVDRPAAQIARMTSGVGEHYPEAETAIDPTRVVRSGVVAATRHSRLVAGTARGKFLELTWTPVEPSVAALWVDLAPRTLDLPDSLIGAYFDEIGATSDLRRQWTDTPSPKRWRESYAKHAKTYVRVGDAQAPRAFASNVGMALEIVPDRDPTLLHTGDSLRVRLLYRSRPLANLTVAAFRQGGSTPALYRTDALGSAWIPLEHEGAMLLAAVHLRRVHERRLEWRSDFSSMTFPVLPR